MNTQENYDVVNQKLHSVFKQLTTKQNTIEDDTVLQKLNTYLTHVLQNLQSIQDTEESWTWAQKCGLINFIETSLDPSYLLITDNSDTCSFSLRALASVVAFEDLFSRIISKKIMLKYLDNITHVKKDISLYSASLNVIKSLLQHKSGLEWLIQNGFWELMMLPSVTSSSIFVQREGCRIIVQFIQLHLDSEYSDSLLMSLKEICCKNDGQRNQILNLNTKCMHEEAHMIIGIYHQLFLQSLGKTPIYSKVQKTLDIKTCVLNLVKTNDEHKFIVQITNLLILNMLHRFQEQIEEYGAVEQFLLDSLTEDLMNLTRLFFDLGQQSAFLKSCVNMHKYLAILSCNLQKKRQLDLTKIDSIFYVIITFQVAPITSLYQDYLEKKRKTSPDCVKTAETWSNDLFNRMAIKETHKLELQKLGQDLVRQFMIEKKLALSTCLSLLSNIANIIEHFHLTSAVVLLQSLVFLVSSSNDQLSPIGYDTKLQNITLVVIKQLISKFNIDWRKCYASTCLMVILCDFMKVSGVTKQVKVSALGTMQSCVHAFIPPVMSMLVFSDRENSIEQMAEVLNVQLSDVNWEVRDSSLELLLTCMEIAQNKYPCFVDWMIRHKLIDIVYTSMGDVETYVQSTALLVLAAVVSIDQIWQELESKDLQQKSLYRVIHDGEICVRRAALILTTSLFKAGRYNEMEVTKYVLPVTQRATDDSDDEVRCSAIKLIQSHSNQRLEQAGMIDGMFPSVTFSSGRITKLDDKEVKARVCKIINWLCQCGYMTAVITALQDPVTNVATEAHHFMKFIQNLIEKYDLIEDLKEIQIKDNKLDNQETSAVNDDLKSADGSINAEVSHNSDKVIDDILSHADAVTVCRLQRERECVASNPDSYSEEHLTDGNIPACNAPILLSKLLQHLEQLTESSIESSKTKELHHKDLPSLLDDILLDANSIESFLDNQRLHDCY